LLLTPSSALRLSQDADWREGKENFAYFSTLMWSPEMGESDRGVREAARQEAKQAKSQKGKVENFKSDAPEEALKSDATEEALIPPGGHKMYGPHMIFKIDNQLREHGSKYPYIVVTDDDRLIQSPLLKDHPNIQLVKVGSDIEFLSLGAKLQTRNKRHAQKLALFNMTQYDKILSLDMDIEIKANLDHIFKDYDTKDGSTVYGMYNDFTCGSGSAHSGDYFNSAIMLLEPREDTFKDLMEFTRTHHGFFGDQAVTQNFFKTQRKEPELFSTEIADFVDCEKRMRKNAKAGKPVQVVHLR